MSSFTYTVKLLVSPKRCKKWSGLFHSSIRASLACSIIHLLRAFSTVISGTISCSEIDLEHGVVKLRHLGPNLQNILGKILSFSDVYLKFILSYKVKIFIDFYV